MVTEKQKCIAEQAIYGDLHFMNPSGNVRKLDVVSSIVAHNDKGGIFTPILRPMSDLTKEITHKGYNDDKPFIPLVELAKIAQGAKTTDHFKLVNDTVVDFTIAYHFKQNVFWFQSIQGNRQLYILPNQNKFFDLLHQLHFDTRNLIVTNEAIDANSLPKNSYEV